MPPVSELERRALYAAAEGQSKLGIPESVGKEFVKNDSLLAPPVGGDLSDWETAEAVKSGELKSPQQYGEFWLFDLRITGTGVAYRDAWDEYAMRDPELWLSDEFVKRCNGLPVIFEHPVGPGLNSEEFKDRVIGTIIMPYIKDQQVWGIAKIFDRDAAVLMQTTHISTSPGVTPPKGSVPIELEGGAKILDEGLPLILDHLAVCQVGVWDKDGPAEGVRLDSLLNKGEAMDKEEREAIEKERDDAKAHADAATVRADAAEKILKDRNDADEAKEKEAEAKEKERDDARKMRHDSGKHDGAHKDCARCDSEEKEERDDKGKRKDAAQVVTIDADRELEIKDSRDRADKLQLQVDKLAEQLQQLHTQPSPEDRDVLARAHLRADSICQKLGETTPAIVPNETSISFRRRVALMLRPFTEHFKTYAFADSVDGITFSLLEDKIYAEAEAHVFNPGSELSQGVLREVRSVENGKQVSRFYGDAAETFKFFRPHTVGITKFNNNLALDRR